MFKQKYIKYKQKYLIMKGGENHDNFNFNLPFTWSTIELNYNLDPTCVIQCQLRDSSACLGNATDTIFAIKDDLLDYHKLPLIKNTIVNPIIYFQIQNQEQTIESIGKLIEIDSTKNETDIITETETPLRQKECYAIYSCSNCCRKFINLELTNDNKNHHFKVITKLLNTDRFKLNLYIKQTDKLSDSLKTTYLVLPRYGIHGDRFTGREYPL